MPSKDGVFYDMEHSPYKSMYGEYTFHFSSRKHMSSFLDKLPVRTEWLNDSFYNRFKFSINVGLLAIFQLYFQVESRGCYIKLADGGVLTCKENLRLYGLKASALGSIQPCESTTTPSEEPCEIYPTTPLFSLNQ